LLLQKELKSRRKRGKGEILMKKTMLLMVLVVLVSVFMIGCGNSGSSSSSSDTDSNAGTETSAGDTTDANTSGGVRIGISMNAQGEERWQRDWAYMKEAAEKAGATIETASADGDEQKQVSDIEGILTKGVDVLIVIPVNADSLSQSVELAHENGVKVIAYDRLITNPDLDYYITFDMIGCGREQAKYLLENVPKGNYYLQEGPTTDSNAQLFYQGQMEILQPAIDSGDIKVVGEEWADDWSDEVSMNQTQNALTANDNKIDAICDANDSTASGAIRALEEQGLAGKVPVTGQDCDLAACQRIAAGTQAMSVFKNLYTLANAAIDSAIAIAQGEEIETNDTYNNETLDVPTLALPLVVATKDNLVDTVIAAEFHSYDDVYENIPEGDRPPRP
jgi:D-xylose transport system substrate-binding protein